MVAGAIGGATGDQIWFYLLRGRIHWFDRYPRLAKYRDRISNHVHSHETAMILVSRFLPGLRTAIPVACAYANVRRLKFSLLNLASAFAWAGAIMLLVRGGSAGEFVLFAGPPPDPAGDVVPFGRVTKGVEIIQGALTGPVVDIRRVIRTE